MLTELVAARQMIRLAASKLDSGDGQAGTYCAVANALLRTQALTSATTPCSCWVVTVMKNTPWAGVRDTRVHQILEGTNQIMRVIISRRMLMASALEVIQ